MFFTFLLLVTSMMISTFGSKIYASTDLLEKAFEPAMTNETIVNLWAGKNAVGNEILKESTSIVLNNNRCFVNGSPITDTDLQTQMMSAWFAWWDREFCEEILWGDFHVDAVQTEAPLIVRFAKFLLRITMILSVTMIIYNGIMWIIESSKWAEVKDAKKNITLIIVGILIALMSLGIINLISSLTVSSLGGGTTETTNTTTEQQSDAATNDNTFYWPR